MTRRDRSDIGWREALGAFALFALLAFSWWLASVLATPLNP